MHREISAELQVLVRKGNQPIGGDPDLICLRGINTRQAGKYEKSQCLHNNDQTDKNTP